MNEICIQWLRATCWPTWLNSTPCINKLFQDYLLCLNGLLFNCVMNKRQTKIIYSSHAWHIQHRPLNHSFYYSFTDHQISIIWYKRRSNDLYEYQFSISNCSIETKTNPNNKHVQIRKWIELKRNELNASWNLNTQYINTYIGTRCEFIEILNLIFILMIVTSIYHLLFIVWILDYILLLGCHCYGLCQAAIYHASRIQCPYSFGAFGIIKCCCFPWIPRKYFTIRCCSVCRCLTICLCSTSFSMNSINWILFVSHKINENINQIFMFMITKMHTRKETKTSWIKETNSEL